MHNFVNRSILAIIIFAIDMTACTSVPSQPTALSTQANPSPTIIAVSIPSATWTPLPGITATRSPTPLSTSLPPLLPTWTVTPAGASDLNLARHTLLTFFTLLHDGFYAEAALLYGGSYDDLRVQNPDVPPDDYAALWRASCLHQTPCLLVARIVESKTISPDEFTFVVEFIWLDGTLFKLGPCCGATETEMPPMWQFPYTVMRVAGEFKVMQGPIYIP